MNSQFFCSRTNTGRLTDKAVLLTGLCLLLLTALAFDTAAQDAPETGTPFLSSVFGDSVPRAETSARLAFWDPEEQRGAFAVRFVYPDGYHQIDDPDYFTLKPEPAEGIVFGAVLKAEPVIKDGLAEYFDETTVVMEFSARPGLPRTAVTINALFQICDENGVCLFPDSQLLTVDFDPESAPLPADPVVQAVFDYHDAGQSSEIPGTVQSDQPLWLYLLMAFAGGILLNIMPCVLPLLSVKALNLIRQSTQSRRAILVHSWIYVAGIETSFLILGILVAVLQASGRLLGWGFQLQSPVFLFVLSSLIWVFALSLFGLYSIEAPQKSVQSAAAAGSRGGYGGSFLTGMFAVLIAAPCTAPLMGAAMGFAFSRPPAVILMIFAVTGLGLGMPFLLLGIRPRIIGKIPKPGPWMNTFKTVMGFLMTGTAVYLLTTLFRLAPQSQNAVLWWITILAFAAWLWGQSRIPSRRPAFRIGGQAAALLMIAAAGFFLIDFKSSAGTAVIKEPDGILFSENDVLARLESDETVFLEFTAAWCTTCKINQRVIKHPQIQSLFAQKNVTHITGDLTAWDETMIRWLADFGRAGVPLYVLFRPGEDPFVFPELLTVSALGDVLERLPDSGSSGK